MIDSHAHIFKEYFNIDDLIKILKRNNVLGVVNCATSFSDSKEVIESSKKYKNFLYAAIGIHPENIDESNIEDIEKLINNNKIVAIGEIGLDYYWKKDNKEKQKEYFIKQIELAVKYNLPVIIHTRESIQDCYDILKKYKVRGVIHCFSGSYEMAVNFLKLGFKLGIGGVLTFKNSNLYKVIEKIDLKDILLETDSPYLSPEPNRGKQNNPSNLYFVAKKIAEIKETTIENVINQTTKNARELFDI